MQEDSRIGYTYRAPHQTLEQCMKEVVSSPYVMSPTVVQIWECKPITVRAFVKNRKWHFEKES